MESATGKALLLSSISRYFKQNPGYITIFREILNGKSSISLRLIDWLVTHYAKTNDIHYWIDDQTNTIYKKIPNNTNIASRSRKFNLYTDYRAQLKSFNKIHFDPFRRHERINFIINEECTIETTVGQLNFFKWFFKNNVQDFIKINITELMKDMSNNYKSSKNSKGIKDNQSKQPVQNKKYSNTIKTEKAIVRFD